MSPLWLIGDDDVDRIPTILWWKAKTKEWEMKTPMADPFLPTGRPEGTIIRWGFVRSCGSCLES